MSRYKKLPADLAQQLRLIEPSVDKDMKYYPCAVKMVLHHDLTCVYIVPEYPYIKYWGTYPEQDPAKSSILIQDVTAVSESPMRLPARFATEIYKAGKSETGTTIFTVGFADGTSHVYMTPNVVDFIQYPKGLSGKDVVEVKPHAGSSSAAIKCPVYSWCLYSI